MKLEGMTAKDLRLLRERIDAVIVRKQQEAKAALRQQFSEMAFQADIDIRELFGTRKTTGKSSAKWRDPKTGVVWSGRGRHPHNFDKERAERIGS